MSNTRGPGVMFEAIESRMLMSVSHFFGSHHTPTPPSAAVQADLTKIRTDEQKLATDYQALAPTLRADRLAISAAIKALDPTLTPLRDKLKADTKAAYDTIKADLISIWTNRSDPTPLAAAKTKLKTDTTAAKTLLKADADAIKAVIDADPAVIAARAKLKTDSQPITDHLATLKADREQLRIDILSQRNGTGGTTGGTTTAV